MYSSADRISTLHSATALREIEVREVPALDAEQVRLLDLHSVLNLLNVVCGELHALSLGWEQAEKETAPLIENIEAIEQSLHSEDDPSEALHAFADLEKPVLETLTHLECHLEDSLGRDEAAASYQNVRNIFRVLERRLREWEERNGNPENWVRMPISDLKACFSEVFSAIEKNARGRFFFRYNLARQGPQDYYVDLRLESVDGFQIWMPPALQDVMRDLVANARKYTEPGGNISLALYQDESELVCVVEDNGRGIPSADLELVCAFGHRAANVQDKRTMGGGFGLTKAVTLVKSWGGRFWIASEEGRGTRMRLWLPTPPLA